MANFDADLVLAATVDTPLIAGLAPHPSELLKPSGVGSTTITHYSLRAHRTSDNTWQQWVDTAVSLASAPGGSGNFDAASLTVQAKVTS